MIVEYFSKKEGKVIIIFINFLNKQGSNYVFRWQHFQAKQASRQHDPVRSNLYIVSSAPGLTMVVTIDLERREGLG